MEEHFVPRPPQDLLKHWPGVLLIPTQDLNLVLKPVYIQPSSHGKSQSRHDDTCGLPQHCHPNAGGSCRLPASVFLLCSDPAAAALSTLLGLSRGLKLCLKNQREFGSQLRSGSGTEGQRTNRFRATWNRWKETIAAGKENNQDQWHVLSLPISVLA